MKPLTRDILVGIVTGLIAVAVLTLRRQAPAIPGGIYQASLNVPKYRELETMLRPAAGSAQIVKSLQTRIDAPDVSGAAFDKMITFIEDTAGVEIDVEWGILASEKIARNEPVTVRLRRVTAAEALRQSLEAVGESKAPLAWQIEAGRIRISLKSVLSRESVVRVYDISDIVRGLYERDVSLRRRRSPPGRALPPYPSPTPPPPHDEDGPISHARPLSFADFATTPEKIAAELSKILRQSVDPLSWHDRDQSGSIEHWSGKLVVVQTRPNQDQIALWLHWIREDLRTDVHPER